MERVNNPRFIEALSRNRALLNSIYECCAPHSSGEWRDAFLRLFTGFIGPLYEKGIDPSDDVIEGIFRESIKLAAIGFNSGTERSAAISHKLSGVVESYSPLLASERGFITSVFNAMFNLHSAGAASMALWAEKITVLNLTDLESLKKHGLVLAWRCGAARFRDAALSYAEGLDEKSLRFIFDLDSETDTASFISSLINDQWFGPKTESGASFRIAGGFSGYGGPFRSIPDVFCLDGNLYASDIEREFRIFADYYGTELIHNREGLTTAERTQGKGSVYSLNREVIINGKSYPLPKNITGNVRSSAVNGNTVAWSDPNSYMVFIAGRVKGS